MILIIGLGNPGLKYKKTRHNVGFRVLDNLQKENNFPKFSLDKKFNSLICQGKINVSKSRDRRILKRYGKKVILAKPQTFMNKSGKTVKDLMTNNQLSITTARPSLVVVHDDIDLPLGTIRVSKNRGSAGHKGVESIIKELGTKDFTRIRIGIQPKTGKPKVTERFVLEKFSKDEEKVFVQIIKKASQSLKTILF